MNNMFLLLFPLFMLFGFVMFFLSFFFLILNFSLFLEWNLLVNSFCLSFPLYIDFMSLVFMGMVSFISGSIIFYSHYYMMSDFFKSRFFFLMFLFVLSMIFLIMTPNLMCMLLGWDGLGLISFCLVIYYQSFNSFNSGMITALTNRVGDVFILTSIGMFFSYGSLNYMNFLNFYNTSVMSMLFLIASMTKSAQIPFSAWLPAAMAAPTPVSSLVHSSTLVTAGVYILIRFNYFLTNSSKSLLMILSLLTMIMSGISGLKEFDLKKIIALSTLSQLGFMMSTISMGLKELSFFHLITHASFKALLFMCAGYFIHSFSDNQDIRFFGLMGKEFSVSLCMFNIANLSLSGFPFLSGFYSKDLILEFCITMKLSYFILFLFYFGTFLTVFYSFRLSFYLSFKSMFSNSFQVSSKSLDMQKSMFLLFFFSIFLGVLGSNLIFLPYNEIVLPFLLKISISLTCLLSFYLSFKFMNFFKLSHSSYELFLSEMWFLYFLKTDFKKKAFFFVSKVSVYSMEGLVESVYGILLSEKLFQTSLNLNNFMKSSFFLFSFMFLLFILFFNWFFSL